MTHWPQTSGAAGTKLRTDNLRAYSSDLVVGTAEPLGFQMEFFQNHLPECNDMVESRHASFDGDYLDFVEFESRRQAEAGLAWRTRTTTRSSRRNASTGRPRENSTIL